MNLLRSFKIIVCVVLVAVTLCGCMNSVNLKDIKDIVVVEGMGIDAVDDELELTLQTLNISSNSGGEMPQGNMTINTTGSGKTIIDAISALSSNISKKLFFGQNKIIVFLNCIKVTIITIVSRHINITISHNIIGLVTYPLVEISTVEEYHETFFWFTL